MKLLVLYEELAGYFMACISEFATQHNCDVLILRKEVNAVAPFHFEESARIKLIDRSTLNEKELRNAAADFKPDAVFCAGWGYKPYLKICKSFHSKVPVVLGFDNWWNGSLRQRVTSIIAKSYFSNHFDRCFVPGIPQKEFALRLGFDEKRIATGAYSCDFGHFNAYFNKYSKEKKINFPKRFIYAGRYSSEKGIELLWKAFINLQDELPNDWELWCLGKGDIEPVVHPKIRHFGFVQPGDMEDFIRQTGVFILPSLFEPWGVVVHEFTAAGFPLLVSENVGAAEAFLKQSQNGFSFRAGDADAISSAMKSIVELTDEKLARMGESSAKTAASITPVKWAQILFQLIHSR
ncbi:MAG: glycosyltransferase family 4 protein [Bacteroidota bacterium]|nr:glycosyltransferase family 4 protein [Bacteroidota bacterium]